MPEYKKEPMTLERLCGLVEKSLSENAMPENFKAQARKELAALTRLGGPAYDLLTAVNIMSLLVSLDGLEGAVVQALTIIEQSEFDARFATRLDEAETYVEKLISLRNSVDNGLVKFLKEASNKVRGLLKELRAPYGVCEACGVNPRTKPFHRTCKSCFKPAPKPVSAEAVKPRQLSEYYDFFENTLFKPGERGQHADVAGIAQRADSDAPHLGLVQFAHREQGF